MSCACIKKREFDISVANKGCEYLVLEDQSTWVNNDGSAKPNTYTLTVASPGRSKTVDIDIRTDVKNYLTSKELIGSKEVQNLQDGIYCFTTESCGYKLTINRAYLCNTESQINQLIARYAPTMTEDEKSEILDLKFKAESVKINAEQGNLQIARDLFRILTNDLKLYHCDNC